MHYCASSLSLAKILKLQNFVAFEPYHLEAINIHPLTLLHLPFYRLLVILAAVIPAASSFAFAERAAFLVVRLTRSAVLTSLRSADAEHPLVFAQSLS